MTFQLEDSYEMPSYMKLAQGQVKSEGSSLEELLTRCFKNKQYHRTAFLLHNNECLRCCNCVFAFNEVLKEYYTAVIIM